MPDKESSDGFDIKFKLLMPELQLKLWTLALDADTSKVNLAYKPGLFTAGLAYNYGGAVEASFAVRKFSTKLGVDPSSSDVDLGLVYRGFKFKLSSNYSKPSLGVGFGYGAGLLPFPQELSSTFMGAAGGIYNIAGSLGSIPNNPLAWYKLRSNDIDAIGKAVSAGQAIHKSGKSDDRFGVGFRVNYAPGSGLTIYGGALYRF